MANLIYLTLNGQLQGLISSGCSSQASIGNKAQTTHLDQIMIYELSHGLTRNFEFYRTNRAGMSELYYKIKLIDATIKDIRLSSPDSLNNPGGQPTETISFTYNSVEWEHCLAGTSAYSLWNTRVY
ncbi:TPA: type VI secretion system tube protein Hcp [Salmonella enterica]|nr:type VI secretion system tube protein Hcp [Salmonella enterica subsp. arizonae]HDY3840296.1 type VI secretion system tube protein Hcp [Salmonella enterica]